MSKTTKQGATDKSGARAGHPSNAREYWKTQLHGLLVRKMCNVKLPVIKEGRIDTKALAGACGVARFTAYRWFRPDRLSPKAATKLNSISKGELTKKDILPFLLS